MTETPVAADRAPVDPAMERLRSILDPARFREITESPTGYLELAGADIPSARGLGQQLMRTRFYATFYQLGRPLGMRIASALEAPGRDADRARTAARLNLSPGRTVLDIACGPGNFTGYYGSVVGADGLAVGVDASISMLTRAVADNSAPSVHYLYGAAERLPFRDESADAISCLAALYLINDPFGAIDEMSRVLKPGGRIVLLTSLAPGGRRERLHVRLLETLSTMRMFGRDEVTGFLRGRGFTNINQVSAGLAQTVWATKS
ncbi:methyltransferase domain-containing protein [Nocardia sp. NPDC006044]|uniref:methyltransferase domain-containing protein n=1 Tax=Nocardia sp. NPDC006044 TaxID=3364306 RepID=UPI0036A18AFA